jgi:hypothetical protein
MDTLIIALLAIGLIGGLGWLQFRALSSWRGTWRWLAAATLAIPAADLLWIVAQISFDPTSHNLWPLELALVWSATLPIFAGLWLAKLALKA